LDAKRKVCEGGVKNIKPRPREKRYKKRRKQTPIDCFRIIHQRLYDHHKKVKDGWVKRRFVVGKKKGSKNRAVRCEDGRRIKFWIERHGEEKRDTTRPTKLRKAFHFDHPSHHQRL